ncbi:MAG: hypothetical protein Q9214_003288 [Letrouitia sp. 1 TL-2023]
MRIETMSSTSRDELLQVLQTMVSVVEGSSTDIFNDEPRRQKLRSQVNSLKFAVARPLEIIFEDLCCQPHQSAAVKIALEGKWLEALGDEKPKTAQEIAAATGAESELVVRIMMVLTATGVVKEHGFQTYGATAITQTLLDPGLADGLRHFFDHCGPSMINLPSYLERNNYKVPQDVKTGPFADAWGGKNTWELYKAEPRRGDVFNSFMTRWRENTRMWTDIYPATSLCEQIGQTQDAVLLVDIGGGSGHVLKDFAQKRVGKGRLILQDQLAALGDIESLKDQGIEAMPYDLFTPQPVLGAKCYYLRAVLHDWPDRACREILRNTIPAMRKGYSKLLLHEAVLPDINVPAYGAFLDISMMALETGAERTSKQWHDLLGSVGLRIEKIWSADGGLESIIEAVTDE